METEYQQKPSPKKPDSKGQANQYIRYSGLAFQMLAIILLGLWLGLKTDHWLGMKQPVFTAVFILAFLIISLYLLIRSLHKS